MSKVSAKSVVTKASFNALVAAIVDAANERIAEDNNHENEVEFVLTVQELIKDLNKVSSDYLAQLKV